MCLLLFVNSDYFASLWFLPISTIFLVGTTEFNILNQGLLQEHYLEGLVAAGLTKMATELQHQNCSGILEDYRKM